MTDQSLIHTDILKRFRQFSERGRLAHAYLLNGPAGIGKKETALGIAKLMNCQTLNKEGLFCDECAICLKITKGHHPDVRTIEVREDEVTMKIEQIRGLLDLSRLRPFEAVKKVFIVRRVEALTHDAANAFLKTLEEPTPSSLILLTTENLDNVLETVKSRCHVVYFLPLAKDKLVSQLKSYYHVEASKAHFLGYYADGSLGQAKRFLDENVFDEKNELIDSFILATDVNAFLKKLSAEKETVKRLLDILLTWVRDAILIKVGINNDRLIHVDRIRDLQKFQARYEFAELRELYQSTIDANALLAENLNTRMAFLIIKERMK